MDYRSLSNVLAVLRFIKMKGNQSAADLLSALAGETNLSPSPSVVMKMASQIIEQVEAAQIVIANSKLDDEAKHGVHASLERVARAFSLSGINTSASQQIGDVGAAISNFVILLSAGGVSTSAPPPTEPADLAKEVEELMHAFSEDGLDPVLSELAKRHLQALATMLRHVPIFGMEAAMAIYFELLVKIQKADAQSNSEQQKKAKPLMERIGSFMDGLKKADEATKAGIGMVGHAKTAAVLFGLLPAS